MSAEKRIFPLLDLLRGVAALAVVGRHLNGELFGWMPGSHLAVDLFFGLSGFVIAHAYQLRLEAGMSAPAFMRLRLIRLYPLYLVGTLMGVAALLLTYLLTRGYVVNWSDFAFSLGFGVLFLPVPQPLGLGHFHLFPFMFPAWSLCWELAVNLIYALIGRALSHWRLIVLIVLGIGLLAMATQGPEALAGGSNYNSVMTGPQRVVFSFFAGIGIYRLWQRGWLNRIQAPGWLLVVVLIAIFMLRPRGGALYDFLMILLVLPVMIMAATSEVRGAAARICAVSGALSYPIYVLHAPLMIQAKKFFPGLMARYHIPSLVLELAFVLAMALLALAADRWLDRPVRRWLADRVPGR